MAPLRYRCTACGNLTRFDVTAARRTRCFHHYSVGGELTVESEEVLSESVEDVSCRWCGHGRTVEALDATTPVGDDEHAGAADGSIDAAPCEVEVPGAAAVG